MTALPFTLPSPLKPHSPDSEGDYARGINIFLTGWHFSCAAEVPGSKATTRI